MIVGSTDHSNPLSTVSGQLLLQQLEVPAGQVLAGFWVYVATVSAGLGILPVLYRPNGTRMFDPFPSLGISGNEPAGWRSLPMPVIPLPDGTWLGVYVSNVGAAMTPLRGVPAGATPTRSVTGLISDTLPEDDGTDVVAMFALTVDAWTPPLIADEQLAARGWSSSQIALAGAVDSRSGVSASAEWHGTTLDERRGAFAVVREGGPLESLVGDVVKVTCGSQSVFVYVADSSDDLVADLSLARRAFMGLSLLSLDDLLVRVEVVRA